MNSGDEPVDSDEIERYLLDIWSGLLGGDVSVNDDFFASGGSSMSAVRMLTRVLSQWETEIDLDRFFQEPTIRTLTDLLTNRR